MDLVMLLKHGFAVNGRESYMAPMQNQIKCISKFDFIMWDKFIKNDSWPV